MKSHYVSLYIHCHTRARARANASFPLSRADTCARISTRVQGKAHSRVTVIAKIARPRVVADMPSRRKASFDVELESFNTCWLANKKKRVFRDRHCDDWRNAKRVALCIVFRNKYNSLLYMYNIIIYTTTVSGGGCVCLNGWMNERIRFRAKKTPTNCNS